ncbi:UDP-N-acetylmuramate--L-alanyl-gamma-D-glutamyl-meso-2,6-diaminoheptandioate ligase [Marinicella pacifica]|uniref:UDP-N-acetylmuramate--L-alanyl-gamma-D-glutamyl-meso-2,6-diaminoheptandioate ligase n=1 Tax=Marinicella pacifica TaxID=1171543 RepID=A0A917FSP6_9GAMM|nr:UDP-N-acetylmuramate:L-alanyl-gamma-D-glutamyl-meso-diaminopimelate ligase [Marinicella pacifica]GGF98700.1 UDP-N-acetylmuramate--L-alanyl-gamma-D-glutamyl-meso-2,6-diaminoheptandioate ligase [Marinicella pacifica]
MKIHILGIGGTFMGGLAAIARQLGHDVTGSDQKIYPPMSTQLEQMAINVHEGYDNTPLHSQPDLVLVGNVMSRGMEAVEYILNENLNYQSGPQWLGETVLKHKTVYAVAGTHGKTTTASMLAWILTDQGIDPGFLIGGVSPHFDSSARLTDSAHFVIEADEYDSAFFDKRAKFVHYHSDVLILNNLEYDHADIYPDLTAIQTQFHHLVRTVPGNGEIIVNADDPHVKTVLDMGCWTDLVSFGSGPHADFWVMPLGDNPSHFSIQNSTDQLAEVRWNVSGKHNQMNALAAILAATRAGVSIAAAADSLCRYENVKRRMELVGESGGVRVFDDFAHHPTAIETTLSGRRPHVHGRLIAVVEPRSNSMRAGVHSRQLPKALGTADQAFVMVYPDMQWDELVLEKLKQKATIVDSVEALISQIRDTVEPGDEVICMSNGGFDNAPRRLADAIQQKPKQQKQRP